MFLSETGFVLPYRITDAGSTEIDAPLLGIQAGVYSAVQKMYDAVLEL
jgi:hypothetical protein